MENNHKTLKVWSIILFVIASLLVCINTSFFGLFIFTDDIGKALLIIVGFFIPLIAILFSTISLIVSAAGLKKLKLCKILTIIDVVFIVIQIIFIITIFLI